MLLLWGEHDVVSEQYGFDGWKRLISDRDEVICKTLDGCAHYSMIENTPFHSKSLNAFLKGYDDNGMPVPEALMTIEENFHCDGPLYRSGIETETTKQ